ncbi:hypothetical protein HOB04_03815 [archaeon]|nr:hypothetical protein [archaeon]
MKKLVLLLIFVLMSSGVLAEISISEPFDVYNLGDRLDVSVDGLVGAGSGNLNFNLACGNKTTNLVRLPASSFSLDDESSWSFYKNLRLDDLEILNLSDIVGNCQVVISIGTSAASTKVFSVTRDVDVSVSLDKVAYNPGEVISVNVEAVKANGELLEGFIDATGASIFSKAVEGGIAIETFSMPETIESGFYSLDIRAYDVDSNGILNEGLGSVSYKINQVASSLVMSLADVVATPGEKFRIGVELFDQSGVRMEGNVLLRIVSPNDEFIEANVQAGEFSDIDFVLNSSAGTWKIFSSFDSLSDVREFEMIGLQKIEFDLEDSVLTIKNIGNVLYNRTIDVTIGDDIMSLELNIGVDEVRKFNVDAPNGEYEVLVNDGETSLSKRVLLTGNAVSIDDIREKGFFSGYGLFWIFLILILGGVGIMLLMRYRKTKVVGDGFFSKLWGKMPGKKKVAQLHNVGTQIGDKIKEKVPDKVKAHMDDSLNFTNKSPAVQGLDVKNYSGTDKTMVDLTKGNKMTAESALVMKGEKQVSSVVAIAVKNHEGLGDAGKDALHKIVDESKEKGLVDWRGDFVFVVFNPLMTRTYDNEGLAVKCGMAVIEKLNDYNKKFKDKVEFGIGVHSGDLVASKGGGKLKYTSIGNTVSFAKRMSDSDSGVLVVSDVVRKKLLRDLKVVKGKDIGEKMTYVVSEVKSKGADAARLKELLKRANS